MKAYNNVVCCLFGGCNVGGRRNYDYCCVVLRMNVLLCDCCVMPHSKNEWLGK